MGFLHFNPKPLDKSEAEALLKEGTYFDYLHGRVMKSDLSGNEFRTDLYDRDNGIGAAERAIATVTK